jgi:DNA helicase-2/ATP-dependent DNA helicase PcrA
MMNNWCANLNEDQQAAVMHSSGPLLILAGAGAGKTTVLVQRAGRLIDEGLCRDHELCVLTFTNKAARELRTRVSARLGDRAKNLWAGTFHSFGLYLLRKFAGRSELAILDQSDAKGLVRDIMRDYRAGRTSAFDPDRLLTRLSNFRACRALKLPYESQKDDYDDALEWLLPRYEKQLALLSAVDFEGLLIEPIHLLAEDAPTREAIERKFQFFMVDEFQDTNRLQMELLKRLVRSHRNLAVVGDDDQSIYGWRGAHIDNILSFPKLYEDTKVVRLENNYRSQAPILQLANHVIASNTKRFGKKLKATRAPNATEKPELFVYENEEDEAQGVVREIQECFTRGVKPRDIAVLYRSNGQSQWIEAELKRARIAHTVSGGTAFFDRKEAKDVLAYCRAAVSMNALAFRRIINLPPRGIGERTLELLNAWSKSTGATFCKALSHWATAGVDREAGARIENFLKIIQNWSQQLSESQSVSATIANFMTAIGYKDYLTKHSRDAHEAQKRWNAVVTTGDILGKFLPHARPTKGQIRETLDLLELRDMGDDEKEKQSVQLMTLHACKGLEFPVVFIIGVEEDLLPHKTLGGDVAEERRLFYVGITRAEKKLMISHTRRRLRYGKLIDVAPSRFLANLPRELLTAHEGARPVTEDERKRLLSAFLSGAGQNA